MSSSSASSAGAISSTRNPRELQEKVKDLSKLFADAIQAISGGINTRVNTLDGSEDEAKVQTLLTEVSRLGSQSTENINKKLSEIRELIEELPGINYTTEELLEQLENEKALSEKAGEDLIKAQGEAKKWLAFIDESENNLNH